MKTRLMMLAALTFPAFAQDAPPPPGTERTVTETVTPGQHVVEETVVEKPTPPPERVVEEKTVVERRGRPEPVVPAAGEFDPARRLSVMPRAVPVPDPASPPPGGRKVETTETTTAVGGRVYNYEKNVVIVEGRELPYVTIPVLFVRETAELLDSESRSALERTAAAINQVVKSDPSARFDIEGHTSTDGADDFNMELSKARAQRIYDELTRRYEISPQVLSAHGYGEMYPKYPNGNEAQLTLDRRVLVVRVK
jgi:hypothetical protein